VRFERKSGHRPTLLVFSVLVIVSLVSLALSARSAMVQPQAIGHTVFATFQSAFHRVGSFVSGTVNSVRELGQLRQDYEELVAQLREYRGIRNDVTELRHEVERLRSLLGFSESLEYQNVPAQIIGKDPGNLFATITINKGRVDGMQRDLPVVAVQEGAQGLVGHVETVGRNTAKVMPILNSSNYVAARHQESRYEGLVQGTGRDEVLMRHVSDQARGLISYGDLIITSGMSSIYPKGIHVGRVRAVQSRQYETSLVIEVDPIVDFARLEYVFVLQE
jgi:rod shape-determining protein MreC